ncbi:serine/threonine protein kinase [Nocardia otitidiscaviarum]|uniref:serine/threonine-protein kinase n=1 Tax=Nocardia otitidiscaviarum TaxID=1823 RepID=UPI00069360B2|nr:serine/threonine-protein kinase [Nocardia otitidiscaviarum]MBF6133810.1 serine/threonine protein kinase [Nocardia otitidiscaviarum]MBF6487838.1 serine/threonine protein kinase [Nocardia otitidiscaviarum]
MKLQPLAADDPNHIGRYRLHGVLGSGGMGRVLLGMGPDGRFVAIKQVHAHLLDEPEYRARFRREVAATTQVSGAFTAPVLDFDVDCPTPWLASVFVLGLPLDKVVTQYGPLPVPSVRVLAVGLASALDAIHRTGVIHRDLKPANVMLTADGPRVIDFGIAQPTETTSQLTEAGSVLGSPAYMSPEQALSHQLTPASDIFSLGSLLAMAATGVSPFQAPSLAYTLFNIAHAEPDLERVPPELRALIAACLRKDPGSRPTPTQVLDHLGHSGSQGSPWPASIHAELGLLSEQLAAIATDPESTQVISATGRQRGSAHSAPPSKDRRRFRIVVAALSGLVVAMVAAATAVWAGRTVEADASDLLTQFREADTCRWVQEALGPELPAEAAAGWPVNLTEWSWEPTPAWGCRATDGKRTLGVEPATSLDLTYSNPTGSEINGKPIMAFDGERSCRRDLEAGTAEQDWGMQITSSGADTCALVEFVLTRMMEVGDAVPRLQNVEQSLASMDPCALLSPDDLNPLIGPLPASPASFDGHSCQWSGRSDISVKLRLYDPEDMSGHPIDLGDGLAVVDPSQKSSYGCTRIYAYREVGGRTEILEVYASGGYKETEISCATAESAMRLAVGNLPA